MSENNVSKNAVVIERIFEASVEVVWQMWTQAEHFKQWYGPQGFTVPVAQLDVRVGGKHLFCMEMQTPDGPRQMWSTGEYLEVVPPRRLVYTDSMADENGNVMSPADMGMGDDYPMATEVIVELEDLGGRTKMVMTHAGLPANSEGAKDGWSQAFNKMADHIASVLTTS